jgi:hypothetical protein
MKTPQDLINEKKRLERRKKVETNKELKAQKEIRAAWINEFLPKAVEQELQQIIARIEAIIAGLAPGSDASMYFVRHEVFSHNPYNWDVATAVVERMNSAGYQTSVNTESYRTNYDSDGIPSRSVTVFHVDTDLTSLRKDLFT